MVGILIITHGEFGAYLLEAAEEIVGRQPDSVVRALAISRRISLAEARERIAQAVQNMLQATGAEGVLVLCDMLGGTPCNETLLLTKQMDQVQVLTGVNLYMAVSAMMQAGRLPLERLAAKVAEDGKRSIAIAKDIFLVHKT